MSNDRKTMEKSEVLETLTNIDEPELKAIVAVLMTTGARVSEVCSLQGKDVSSDEKYIYFNMKLLKRQKEKGKRIIRNVPKEGYIISHFLKWINELNDIGREDPVFSYDRKKVWRKLKEVNPEIHPHMFRHTLATWMLKEVDMRTLQEWFGWSTFTIAESYTHPQDAIKTFSEKMGGVLE